MRLLAACVLLALLAAPAAAVPRANVTYAMTSPTLMEVSIEAQVEGQEALGQRRLLDTDKDGTVSAAEVRRSANSTMNQVNQMDGAVSVPGGKTLLDGKEHLTTTIARLEIHGLGPVNNTEPVRQSWLVRLAFTPPANQTFVFTIDVGNTSYSGNIPMQVLSATIRAPPGHVIAGTGGLPITAATDQTSVVLPSGLPSTGQVQVKFAPGTAGNVAATTKAAPVSPLLAIAAVAVGLLVSRRGWHPGTSIHKR